MENELFISLIVPVFNRPVEVEELLESLTQQSSPPFEVVLVEDGSTEISEEIVNKYTSELNISYYYKENSGPGQSRNYGAERAKGNYFIFLDSDCILPKDYMKNVSTHLQTHFVDCFGGPDKAHESFSPIQKAINFSMTSFLTTGGIRGGGEKMEKFTPRSFNMGYSKAVFDKTEGFAKIRFGEDIDMSIRIRENDFTTALFKDAFVYHKRRSTWKQFFKQIYNSGIARINLYKLHPQSLKVVHFAPALFLIGCTMLIILSLIFSNCYFLLPIAGYFMLIFIFSSLLNKNLYIGFLSLFSAAIQLFAYGYGFLMAFVKRVIFNGNYFTAFERTFYK